MGCGKLISKKSEGVGTSCQLQPVAVVAATYTVDGRCLPDEEFLVELEVASHTPAGAESPCAPLATMLGCLSREVVQVPRTSVYS